MKEPSKCNLLKKPLSKKNIRFSSLFKIANQIKAHVHCPILEDIDFNQFYRKTVNFQNTVKIFRSFMNNREKVIWPLRACPDKIYYFTDKEDRRDVKYLREDYRRYSKNKEIAQIRFCTVQTECLNLDQKNIIKIKKKYKLSRINIFSNNKPKLFNHKAIIKTKPCTVKLNDYLNETDNIKCISNLCNPDTDTINVNESCANLPNSPINPCINEISSSITLSKPCFVRLYDLYEKKSVKKEILFPEDHITNKIITRSYQQIPLVNEPMLCSTNSEYIETKSLETTNNCNLAENVNLNSEVDCSDNGSNETSKHNEEIKTNTINLENYELKGVKIVLDNFLAHKPLTRKRKSLIFDQDYYKSLLSNKNDDSNSICYTDSTSSIVSDYFNGIL